MKWIRPKGTILLRQTFTYRWTWEFIKTLWLNKLDSFMALVFAGLIGWLAFKAFQAGEDSWFNAFAGYWGDFGGSLIGALIAFFLARLTIEASRKEQERRALREAAPAAMSIRYEIETWLKKAKEQLTKVREQVSQIEALEVAGGSQDPNMLEQYRHAFLIVQSIGRLPQFSPTDLGKVNPVFLAEPSLIRFAGVTEAVTSSARHAASILTDPDQSSFDEANIAVRQLEAEVLDLCHGAELLLAVFEKLSRGEKPSEEH